MASTVLSIVLNNFLNDTRVLKEAQSLQNAGYDVQVVALHEKGLKEFDVVQGIPVHRVKLKSRNWSKNKLIQVLKYIEFLFRVFKKYKNTDIVHCHDLNALPLGVLFKKIKTPKVKVVYDAHEFETEVSGLSGFQKKVSKQLEKRLIKYTDAVITVSESIADAYASMYNIKKPHLILNTPRLQKVEKTDIFRDKFDIKKEQNVFLYQGGLSKGRGIEVLLETFTKTSLEDVIVFMGYGVLADQVKAYSIKHANIYYHEAVSPQVLLTYTTCADYGISMIENVCLSYQYCLPNKMFEYTMAEIPFIVSNLTEMKRLVTDYEIGVVANENSVSGLLRAIKKIKSLNKTVLQNNLIEAKKVFNWEQQEKVLLEIYSSL